MKAAGQVAAQGHQALDAHGLEPGELLAHGLARRADAREMRRRADTLLEDLGDGAEGAFLGRTAGAVGDRAELGPERIQRLARDAQLGRALGRLGREEFEADGQCHVPTPHCFCA
jgi:hypothetical protein